MLKEKLPIVLIHSLCVGWRNFFPVVLLCQFLVLVGNRFWFYILMYLEYNTGLINTLLLHIPPLALTRGWNDRQRNEYTCCTWAGGTFFQLCCCASFWFWRWCKPPRKVQYKRTFGAPDRGQTLDMWENQTSESALRWRTCHIMPHHILELTLEVILEVILEHMLGIKIMTSLILDHVARAYLYLGISTGEKVMILLLSHSLGVVTAGQNKT